MRVTIYIRHTVQCTGTRRENVTTDKYKDALIGEECIPTIFFKIMIHLLCILIQQVQALLSFNKISIGTLSKFIFLQHRLQQKVSIMT